MNNETFFEAGNGWQFQVDDNGHIRYKFRDSNVWDHLGTQLALGFIEWGQSEIWMEETDVD